MNALLQLAVCISGGVASEGTVVYAPTATTLGAGNVQITLIDMLVPSIAVGVTEDLDLGATGTWVPHGEFIVDVNGKLRWEKRGSFSVATYFGLGVAYPEQNLGLERIETGQLSWLPWLGHVMSFQRVTDALDVHVASTVLVPVVHANADAVMLLTPGFEYHLTSWGSIIGEVTGRVIVPVAQGGVTLSTAARFRFMDNTMAADVGWLIDFGVVGPPLPVVSIPGVPVLSFVWLL